jgi:4-hydroxy-3-polyprenylbenzoate decarboxylase
MKKRLTIAISGATGVVYGVRLLEILRSVDDVETHLIMSRWAIKNIEIETSCSVREIKDLADCCYDNDDLGARISSGSFPMFGMVIVPCSMKTLSSVANGYADSLISRNADVALKERRRLVIVPRETPLNSIHLENMLNLSRMGVYIAPPMPSFYHVPKTIDDLVNHFCGRLLDLLDISGNLANRWNGINPGLTDPGFDGKNKDYE